MRSGREERDTNKSTSRLNNCSSIAIEISLQDTEAELLYHRKNAPAKAFKVHHCRSNGPKETSKNE